MVRLIWGSESARMRMEKAGGNGEGRWYYLMVGGSCDSFVLGLPVSSMLMVNGVLFQ